MLKLAEVTLDSVPLTTILSYFPRRILGFKMFYLQIVETEQQEILSYP